MHSTFQELGKVCDQTTSGAIKQSLLAFGLPFEVLDNSGLVLLNKLPKVEFVKKIIFLKNLTSIFLQYLVILAYIVVNFFTRNCIPMFLQ